MKTASIERRRSEAMQIGLSRSPEIVQRNKIVVENQLLVHKIAVGLEKTYPNIPYADLVSAGTIGLIKAVERHNPSKARLSTFAQSYIRGEILREIRDKWQPVKINREYYESYNKLGKLQAQQLDDEAIATRLQITVDRLWDMRKSIEALKTKQVTSEEMEAVENEPQESLSLNLLDQLPQLTPRTKEIFELICCLGRTTTEAIALKLGISQSRARDYTNQLKKRYLIKCDRFFYTPNFEQVVIEGIKNKVQQKIEITNFLAKLEELMKLKAKTIELERELKAQGGDRTQWIIDNLAVQKFNNSALP